MSLVRPRSSVNLTRKIIELLKQPVAVTELNKRRVQIESLLKQLEDTNIVIDMGTAKNPRPTTILMEACGIKFSLVLELVLTELKAKPDFNINQVVPGLNHATRTPLLTASHFPVNIKILLEAGADVRFVSPRSLSPLVCAIRLCNFKSVDVILTHMLQTHASVAEATQKDIIIYADALAHIIIEKKRSPENMAEFNVLFDRIIDILKSPHSGYPSDSLEQIVTRRFDNLYQEGAWITLCAHALSYADIKAIATFRPFMSESNLGEKGYIFAMAEAIRSNSPCSYLTLYALKFDLLSDNCICHAAKVDSDLFLQFALSMIAQREQCDSIQDLLARRDGAATNGRSLLMTAVGSQAIKVVKFLFANGVSANELDDDQRPIFWSVLQQIGPDLFNSAIKDGIMLGQKLDHSDAASVNGKVVSIRSKDKIALDIVEIFLTQQVDVSYIDPVDQNDCFMLAAQSQNFYLCHLLLTRCRDLVDLNRRNAKQQSLAQVAAGCLNVGMLRLIMGLYSNGTIPLQLSDNETQNTALRDFSDCMLSYVLCVEDKWLHDKIAQRILKSDEAKGQQRLKLTVDIIEFCENVIPTSAHQCIGQSEPSSFSRALEFAKMIHRLLYAEMNGNSLAKSNSLSFNDFQRISTRIGLILSEHEVFLNECLDTAFDSLKSSMPKEGHGNNDPLYRLSNATLAAHLRLTQYYLYCLTNRLLEIFDPRSGGYIDLHSCTSAIKLIDQLSTVIRGIFDSLQLNDLAGYLFKDMVELGNCVRENLNLIDQFKNNTSLRNKSDKNRSAVRPQSKNIKRQSIFSLTQEQRSEVDASIANMLVSKNNVKSAETDPLLEVRGGADTQSPVLAEAIKIDNAIAKRKAKNAKKKTRLKKQNAHSAIPEESAIERSEAVSNQDQPSDTPATMSKSVSLSEKIDQLEARILRRQQMWEASEAKKLFDKQRERIEETISLLRLIKRDEQPSSSAELEMKVRAEFKKVYDVMKPNHNFYFVGGAVINFRKNIKFDSEKYDVDIVGKVPDKSILDKFRLSLFVGDERSNLYMYKSDQIDLDLLCYKPDAELDLNDDVLRRDYTICSVYLNMKGYVDPTGLGLSDIDNNILRMNSDPEQLKNDPVRLLRGLKYILRGFNPEPRLHAVLMDLDESLFQNLDTPKMISLQIKSREFFEAYQVDWRNVLSHYQQQHRPKPGSSLQMHGAMFYTTASEGSVSSNQLVPEHARPSLSN